VAADKVAARLAAIQGVQRVPNRLLDLFIMRDFLDVEACAALSALVAARRRPSTIADDQGIADFRTSETCDLDPGVPVVADLCRRLSDLTGIPQSHGEPPQGQRYAPGQHFRAHTDSFNPGSADYYLNCAESGQRTWTAMAYLDRPEAGGATRFKAIGKTIQPEAGKLLLWNNLLADGSPNPATLHEGMRVRQGIKTIVTLWYRERPFA